MSIQNLDFGTASPNDGESPTTAWPKVQANFEDLYAQLAALGINSLTDVVITNPTNGQVLKFNGINWVNGTDSTGGGGASAWGDLTGSLADQTDLQAALDAKADDEFIQSGTGATARTVQNKLRESGITPTDFAATGDGSTNDWTNYGKSQTEAAAQNSAVYLPSGKTFELSTNEPTRAVNGPGRVKVNGYTLGELEPRLFPARASVYLNPSLYGDQSFLYSTFPTNGGQGNTVIGAGAFQGGINAAGESSANVRNTVLGALALTTPVAVERTEAIGQGVLRWCRYGERNSAIGSLSMQWGGGKLDNDPAGQFYQHDLLYNAGTPTSSGSWDAYGLETLLSGTRASINSWLAGTPYATATSDFAYNVSQGRDTLCEIVQGERNTAMGYRALSLLLDGDNNSAFGDNALFSSVLVSNNTACGRAAGMNHVSGNGNTYLGRNAGFNNISGANNVYIGNNAGNGSSGTNSGSGNVVIGNSAGTKADGTVAAFSDKFRLQNSATQLLVQGDFSTGWLGVGVPEAETAKGRLHAYTATVSQTPQTSGDELVLEGTDAGMSILSGSTTTGSIFFGDSGSAIAGYVQYNHNSDFLRFGINASEKARLNVEGLKIGGTAARASTAGTNALHIFDGTAPAGTLTNGCSLYSTSGEMRVMDAAGNATLISPHDRETNEWIYHSVDTKRGKGLRIDVERMFRKLDEMLGGGFVHEFEAD